MVPQKRSQASMSWAYAYQLNPPQPEPRFAKVKALLRRARQAAQRDGRLWTGQMVMEAHITHILVVTDDPHEVRAVDRAIGTELKRLKMVLDGTILTQDARAEGFGNVQAPRLSLMASQVSDAFGTKERVNPDAVWNGSFLPPAADRDVFKVTRK